MRPDVNVRDKAGLVNVHLTDNENQVFVRRNHTENSITTAEPEGVNLLPIVPHNFTEIARRGTTDYDSLAGSEVKILSNTTPTVCIFNGQEYCGATELVRTMQVLRDKQPY